MYNAQKARDVGESECSCVVQEIGVQTLPHPKGGRKAKEDAKKAGGGKEPIHHPAGYHGNKKRIIIRM